MCNDGEATAVVRANAMHRRKSIQPKRTIDMERLLPDFVADAKAQEAGATS